MEPAQEKYHEAIVCPAPKGTPNEDRNGEESRFGLVQIFVSRSGTLWPPQKGGGGKETNERTNENIIKSILRFRCALAWEMCVCVCVPYGGNDGPAKLMHVMRDARGLSDFTTRTGVISNGTGARAALTVSAGAELCAAIDLQSRVMDDAPQNVGNEHQMTQTPPQSVRRGGKLLWWMFFFCTQQDAKKKAPKPQAFPRSGFGPRVRKHGSDCVSCQHVNRLSLRVVRALSFSATLSLSWTTLPMGSPRLQLLPSRVARALQQT